MRFRPPLLMTLFLLLTGAGEPFLVPDVSQRRVEIRYSFTGAELLLFGAIAYPDGRIPNDRADIAVVLKGPSQSIKVRSKGRVAGLWMNIGSAGFGSAPGYYAIATSRPIKQLIDERTAAIYELGLGNIQLSPGTDAGSAEQSRFENGLIDLMAKRGLYSERPGTVEITKGVLYQARLAIPARTPVGHYVAETFLIRHGKVIAAATRDIDIRKSGFERAIANFADGWPLLYGLFAVTLSVLFGWAASLFFRRF
jgi:uncharacterized protein (TIGR02186 family)